MKAETWWITLIVGSIALGQWALICRRARSGPLGWTAPASLFALGLLVLYITPSLYWLSRPWPFSYPPYYDGLPLVMTGAVLLGLPFLLVVFGRRPVRLRRVDAARDRRAGEFGAGLWWCLAPILAGVAYRLFLFTLGYQSRNVRETPTVFGSDSLALLVGNVADYAPVFYFALVALGNRLQRRAGALFWALDALLQLMSLSRFFMLYFVFRSALFMTLTGRRLTRKQWVSVAVFASFVIVVVGRTAVTAREVTSTSAAKYLSPGQVVSVIAGTAVEFVRGDAGQVTSLIGQALDDTFDRLYMARSASAVMMNVPAVIPYSYGSTFMHVLYAWIPRYIWPEKPTLGDIHRLTTLVMPDDSGVNPTGTIAELYISGGFVAVLLGGIVCAYLCRAQERVLLRRTGRPSPAWICVYPSLGLWFLWADANLSQRIAEGLHVLLLFGLVRLFLRFARRRGERGKRVAMLAPAAVSS